MKFNTARVLWNNIEKKTSMYTISEMLSFKKDFENVTYSKKGETLSTIGLMCILIAALCLMSYESSLQLQNTIFVSTVLSSIGMGIIFLMSYSMRMHQQNTVSCIVYKIADCINQKKKLVHQKNMIVQRSIDAWDLYLSEQNIAPEKIQTWKEHVNRIINIESIEDPTLVLSTDCVFLKIAARRANIPLVVFTNKMKTIPLQEELLCAV